MKNMITYNKQADQMFAHQALFASKFINKSLNLCLDFEKQNSFYRYESNVPNIK